MPGLVSRFDVGAHDTVLFQSKAHLIMSLLHERGAASRAMMQPDVNHRVTEEMFFNEWTADDKGGKQKPMMQSFISQDDADRFTFANPISCILYETYEPDEDDIFAKHPSRLIKTHLPMTISRTGEKRFTGHGVMGSSKGSFCSLDAFNRLLALFGLKMPKKKKELELTPTDPCFAIARIDDIYTFLNSFDQEDLEWKNVEGFKKFLVKYSRIGYTYQEDLTLRQNINLLSFWIRALVPVRAAIPDGQHRGQIFTYCLFGNFQIDSHAPLHEFQDDEWKGVDSSGENLKYVSTLVVNQSGL